MGKESITWKLVNDFQEQVRELTMITLELLNEPIVEQPVKPSTQNETGEQKQSNKKFSLLNIFSWGRQKSTRSEKNIRIYQDGEWIEE